MSSCGPILMHLWQVKLRGLPAAILPAQTGKLTLSEKVEAAEKAAGEVPEEELCKKSSKFVWNFADDVRGKIFSKDDEIWSEKFTRWGVPDMQLCLYPQGDATAPEGQKTVFLHGPAGWVIKFKISIGDVVEDLMETFVKNGQKWGFDYDEDDSTELVFELLEAKQLEANSGSLPAQFVWNFADDVRGKTFRKGNDIRSEKFTLKGVPGMWLSLYPRGDKTATKGQMSVYLHGPAGWQINYKISLGDVVKVSAERRTFEDESGWGWADFASVGGDATELVVELLEAEQVETNSGILPSEEAA